MINNRNISPKWTLGLAIVSYLVAFVAGTDSVVGDSFKLLGFILLALAIVSLIESAIRNRNK